MIHVAVIVITFRRADGLLKLLTSLEGQRVADKASPFRLSVVVVDNDAGRSAEKIAATFVSSDRFIVNYVVQPEQGIPIARNTGIESVPVDADFACFIDDDEWAGETWISDLISTQQRTQADCVLGAVIPVYPSDGSKWIIKSKVFDSWNFSEGEKLTAAASNNVMVSTKFLKDTHHRFDERMRMTGGSDFLFFKQAVKLGLNIVWSSAGHVYEDIPPGRMTARWLVQRQYRLGNTFSIAERLDGSKVGIARLIFVGLARFFLGLMLSPAIIFSPYWGMRAFVHILRGVGIISGIFGHYHQEYSKKNIEKIAP